ncbi:DUF3558 domain-containing protein [Allokutzneria multivorans]|uniref:DUF3558 domain-containing protein n=1 Tax=Allokutzneria multivorans TaxID=1142134 RepID=UPI0031E8AEC6
MLAGCGQVTPGEPAEVVRGPDGRFPPPIPNPSLSYDKYLTRPCELLSREQLMSIGIITDLGRPGEHPLLGPECRWTADRVADTGFSVLLMSKGDGLRPAYKSRNFGYFAETTIGGYPALNTDNKTPTGKPTPVGTCDTAVGIGDSVAFTVAAHGHKPHPDYEEPCKASDKVALWVLEKLKAGS